MYHVYQLGGNTSVTLSLQSLGPRYFFNGQVFHTEEYEHSRKTYNSGVCVKESTCNEFEVHYNEKLVKVIKLQYHSEQNRLFLFKYYWYDTIDKGIRVDLHHVLIKINLKARLCNVNNVFVFNKQCQQVCYTYTPSFRNDRSRVDWLFIVKTKPKGCVEVVQDENNELTVGDDVFQLGELVDPYQVASSNNLEKKSIFCITKNIFVDVDDEELNDVLSSSRHMQVDEDDNNEINAEDCDKDNDESIDKKEDNYD
jgi:hypothetical protein